MSFVVFLKARFVSIGGSRPGDGVEQRRLIACLQDGAFRFLSCTLLTPVYHVPPVPVSLMAIYLFPVVIL